MSGSKRKALADLFVPGSGLPPPHMPGHKDAHEALETAVSGLREGCIPPAEIVLVGPRGNGKTSLLRHWQTKAERSAVDVLWLTPKRLPVPEELTRRLVYGKAEDASAERTTGGWGAFGWFSFGSETRRTAPASPAFLPEEILRRRKGRPWLVVVDEAHTLAPEVAGLLLNTSQELRGAGLAFRLVLAGTPGLRSALSAANSTFWGRARKADVGLLSASEAADAIREPLKEAGVEIAGAALERAVADSQGYPYFVQLWGQGLVGAMEAAGDNSIEVRHAEIAVAAVEREREAYYKERYAELRKAGLLQPAEAAAAAFAGRETLPEAALYRILAEALGEPAGADATAATVAAHDALEGLGFFWSPPMRPGLDYVAGIPSLLSYVREFSPAPDDGPDETPAPRDADARNVKSRALKASQ